VGGWVGDCVALAANMLFALQSALNDNFYNIMCVCVYRCGCSRQGNLSFALQSNNGRAHTHMCVCSSSHTNLPFAFKSALNEYLLLELCVCVYVWLLQRTYR